mgnify:FL=1|jgi:hypothetical protein
MSNTIRIKRGKSNNLSVSNLQDGELALTLDTNKLYTNKGQISPDNVYVGDTEPTDSSVKCWISPSGKIDLSSLWDQIYPVGSIYITANATNPSVLFGGTWEQLKGKFLVGVDSSDTDFETSGKTGGEKTHTLTVDEIPSHTHDMDDAVYGNYKNRLGIRGDGGGSNGLIPSMMQTTGHSRYRPTNTGGGQAHNNMPPYLAVYMWKRIS